MLLSTIKCYYEGTRELFKESLYISSVGTPHGNNDFEESIINSIIEKAEARDDKVFEIKVSAKERGAGMKLVAAVVLTMD